MPMIHRHEKPSHYRCIVFRATFALHVQTDLIHNHFSFSVSGDSFQLFGSLLLNLGHYQPKKKDLTKIAFPTLAKRLAKRLFYNTWQGITLHLLFFVALPCGRQQPFLSALVHPQRMPDKIQLLDRALKMLAVPGARNRPENQDKYEFSRLYWCEKVRGTIHGL